MRMSKALKARIEQLFEAVKDLKDKKAIEPHCQEFSLWIEENTSYSAASLGTVLSRNGFYKLFRSISLAQGENAQEVPKHDASGNVVGYELKHYAVLLCGLSQQQWLERNEKTIVLERLADGGQALDPIAYLQVTGKLLVSTNPHELAVGLIAATGRRPYEILATAKFTPIEGEDYQVMFAGQAKKRGEKPVFAIATLFPAKFIIKALGRLRRMPESKELRGLDSKTIDDRRGQSLRKVVHQYYESVLPIRGEDSFENNKGLRAAYGCLATHRDCQGSVGAKMLHYSKLMGHFVKEKPSDRDLQAIATSIGYADYYVPNGVVVPFPDVPKNPNAISRTPLHAIEADVDWVRQLQKEWGLPSQHEVVTRLFGLASEMMELKQQRFNQPEPQPEALAQPEPISVPQPTPETEPSAQAQSEPTSVPQPTPEPQPSAQAQPEPELQLELTPQAQPQSSPEPHLEVSDAELGASYKLALLVEKAVESKLSGMIERIEQVVESKLSVPAAPQIAPEHVKAKGSESKPAKDWSAISSEELKGAHTPNSAAEKIRRGVEAIMDYNNYSAPSNAERWYIGVRSVQEVTGCNYKPVAKFLKDFQEMVSTHNLKYGLGSQHNKRHEKKISEVVKW